MAIQEEDDCNGQQKATRTLYGKGIRRRVPRWFLNVLALVVILVIQLQKQTHQLQKESSSIILEVLSPTEPVDTTFDTTIDATVPALYRNLSCPFEWSKFSCFHQNRTAKAEAAYDVAQQAWEAAFPWFQEERTMNKSNDPQKWLLVGDSTMRQIFISLGCILWTLQELESYEITWIDDWPCQETKNCIPSGNHSGFTTGHHKWRPRSGGVVDIHFVPIAAGGEDQQNRLLHRWQRQWNTKGHLSINLKPSSKEATPPLVLTPQDVIVYNIGLHAKGEALTNERDSLQTLGRSLVRAKQQKEHHAPILTYLTTVNQHFFTEYGLYGDVPEHIISNGGPEGDTCRHNLTVPNPLQAAEVLLFQEGDTVDKFIAFDETSMGYYHIGDKDCTHYCMPGPSDLRAISLMQQLRG